MSRVSAVLGAVVVAGAVACSPQPPGATSPRVDDYGMTAYLDGLVEVKQFRGAVDVRRGGEVLLSRGFDLADVAGRVRNEPGTRFRIASLTKQITAMAVLVLQEQGKLTTTDKVCALLPDCPATWSAITVEHLLTHTSGLFNYTDMTDEEAAAYMARFGTVPTPAQLLATFTDRPLQFPPGSRYAYSNSGYEVLGVLVEHLSGQTYGEFLDTELFGPLGMSESAYQPDEPASRDNAVGYATWSDPATEYSDAVGFASGGIRSTVTDMARWNGFLLTGSPAIVSRDSLAQLRRPRVAVPDSPLKEQYGYGILSVRAAGDTLVYHHAGSVDGFATYSEIHPDTGLSIVVFSNIQTANATQVTQNLAALARR